MRELDVLDAGHGLGAMPGAASRHRRRRGGSPFLAAIVVVGTLLVAMAALQPGSQLLLAMRLFGLAPDRYGSPPDFTPGAGEYAFLQTQRGSDEPVGYDPCEPIEYVVNTAGAPRSWESLVRTSVAHTEWATGLDFVFHGSTEDRPFNPRQASSLTLRDQPVIIGWADSDEFPELAGDVAGLGGSVGVVDGFGRQYFDTGSVVLDTEVFASGEVSSAQLQAIVDHELGHLVGLDHVDSTAELMHATSTARLSYGDGDLEGLARLGSIPCG